MQHFALNRSKIAVAAFFAATLVLVAPAGVSSAASTSGGTFTVGVTNPLSGQLAAVGAQLLAGEKGEADYLNAHGGILGHKVNIVSENDGGEPQQTIAATQQLTQQKLNAFIPDAVLASSVLAFTKGILTVDACSETICGNGVQYPDAFTVDPPSSNQITPVVAIAKKDGYKKIAILTTDDADGQNFVTDVSTAAPKDGIQITGQQLIPDTATSATSQVATLKAENPQAVLLWVVGAATPVILDAFQSLGWKVPILAPAVISTGGNLAQQVPSSVLSQLTCICFAATTRPVGSSQLPAQVAPIMKASAKYLGSNPPAVQTEVFGAEPLAAIAYAYNKAGSLNTAAAVKALDDISKTNVPKGTFWFFAKTNPAFHGDIHSPEGASVNGLFTIVKLTTPYIQGTYAGVPYVSSGKS